MRCPRGPEPKLDGDLQSAEWAAANWIEIIREEQVGEADKWQGPEDGSMKVGLLRGEKQLFLGIEVKDDLVKNTAILAQLSSEDAVEICLEVEPDKDLFDAAPHPKHTGVVTFAARGDVDFEKRFIISTEGCNFWQISPNLWSSQAEFLKTETGYILKIMMLIDEQKVFPGMVIGFNIGFDDADQNGYKYGMMWSGYGGDSQASRYGFLIFD